MELTRLEQRYLVHHGALGHSAKTIRHYTDTFRCFGRFLAERTYPATTASLTTDVMNALPSSCGRSLPAAGAATPSGAKLSSMGSKSGYWGAKELRRITEPRAHMDIDPLYPQQTFHPLDHFLPSDNGVMQITVKLFAHKRAFVLDGVMVEMFLVQLPNDRLYTDFWGSERYTWPDDTSSSPNLDGLKVASVAALPDYRQRQAQESNERHRAEKH